MCPDIRFTYNNPLRYVDPDGHEPEDPTDNPDCCQQPIPVPVPVPVPIIVPSPADAQRVGEKVVETVTSADQAVFDKVKPLGDKITILRLLRQAAGTEPAPVVPAPPLVTTPPPPTEAQMLPPPLPAQAHKPKKQSTGKGSNEETHQKGVGRKLRDQGGEKADPRRKGMPFHKKRPPKWKGPWPQKPEGS